MSLVVYIETFSCYGFGIGVTNRRGCLVLNEAWNCLFHWFAMQYLGHLTISMPLL